MLIIGVGNEMRGDDAAGLYAARALNKLGISAIESNGDGAALMDLWKNESEVIVIDAARSGSPPGTIHRFEAHSDAFPADVLLFSTHLMGLPEAIELSRALGELPKTLIVYGIEGKSFEINQPISPEASLGIGRFINATVETLRKRQSKI